MATAPQNKSTPAPSKPATPPPAAAKPSNGASSETKKERKPPKVRMYSTKEPTYYVRVFQSFVEKYGAPLDPWGGKMEAKASDTSAARAARTAAKEAEKAKMAGMTDEQKLAYAKQQREAKSAEKAAKKSAEREELKKQLKAELEAEMKAGK